MACIFTRQISHARRKWVWGLNEQRMTRPSWTFISENGTIYLICWYSKQAAIALIKLSANTLINLHGSAHLSWHRYSMYALLRRPFSHGKAPIRCFNLTDVARASRDGRHFYGKILDKSQGSINKTDFHDTMPFKVEIIRAAMWQNGPYIKWAASSEKNAPYVR